MVFEINGHNWLIFLQSSDRLIKMYKEEYPEEEVYFVGGVTNRAYEWIAINADIPIDQQLKALKHELTHCYIWEYGLYNVPNFNEEMVCDLVASLNDFISRTVEDFKKSHKELEKEEREER